MHRILSVAALAAWAGRACDGRQEKRRPRVCEIAVANLQDDSVSIIDATAAREIARVSVGDAPVQVAWSPDGRMLFASLRDEDAVAVVDAASRRKVTSIGVGDGPILFTTPDGAFLYVANEGASGAPSTTVSVIDTAGSRVVKMITVGNGPHGVVISTDGRRVYVTNRFSDTVSEIYVATQAVQRTFRVGDEPTGVTSRWNESPLREWRPPVVVPRTRGTITASRPCSR